LKKIYLEELIARVEHQIRPTCFGHHGCSPWGLEAMVKHIAIRFICQVGETSRTSKKVKKIKLAIKKY